MKKIPSLNGLRAISVFLVVIHHLVLQKYIELNFFREVSVFRPFVRLIENGQLGVNVFFVISGYLITLLLIREKENRNQVSYKNFFLKRVLRIFPAYFFLLLSYFLLQLGGYIYIDNTSWFTAITYTKYFNWKDDWYTSHGWSLSIEEHFYLFWPFIFSLGSVISKRFAFFLIFFSIFVRVLSYHYPISWVNENTIFYRIDSIAVGCLLAFYKDSIISFVKIEYWKVAAFISFFAIVLAPYWYYVNKLVNVRVLGSCLIGEGTGILVNVSIGIIMLYSVYISKGLWFKILNSKIFDFIGVLSYSIYLWQQFFTHNGSAWYNRLPINIFLLLSFSLFSYYVIEKPFLKLKDKIK